MHLIGLKRKYLEDEGEGVSMVYGVHERGKY